MKLSTLLSTIPIESSSLVGDPEIHAVCYSSRDVTPGSLFVAMKGLKTDGYQYIPQALEKGAVAILAEKPYDTKTVVVENAREILPIVSARFYQNPTEGIVLIGITGTNGKTTTSYLVESILQAAGYEVGVIGTINYRFQGNSYPNPMTTPESTDLQQILAQMKEQGVSRVVMEVSSHSVSLHRVDECAFDIGIFTNFSQDHLDYYETMDQYWDAKKRFFTDLLFQSPKKNRMAIVNGDDPKGKSLQEYLRIPYLVTGTNPSDDIAIEIDQHDLQGIQGSLLIEGNEIPFQSPLCGDYNIENILSAVGAAKALKIPSEKIVAGISNLKGIPGRLEKVENNQNRYVFVDYAHTPDALEHVIQTLRKLSSHRLICVFGCGGDRDTQKRPLMGEIASRLADLVILTSDNPRTEDPLTILADIEKGISKDIPKINTASTDISSKGYKIIPDRKEAIYNAIQSSGENDIILIAGKGHENYQILKDQTIFFDDRIEAQKVLSVAGAKI